MFIGVEFAEQIQGIESFKLKPRKEETDAKRFKWINNLTIYLEFEKLRLQNLQKANGAVEFPRFAYEKRWC